MDREAVEAIIGRPLTEEEHKTINWLVREDREMSALLMSLMFTASAAGYRKGVHAAVDRLARVRA